MRILADARALAARNENDRWQVPFVLYEGWLALEAGDPERGGELVEHALELSRANRYRYGQVMGLVLLGRADLLRGQLERASRYLAEAAEAVERAGPRDWMIQLPLIHGLAVCALGKRSPERASAEAERLRDLADACGERTWLALAWQALAEASIAQGDRERAGQELAPAIAALEGIEAPLAAWRVYDSAARLERARCREWAAADFEKRRATILHRLAGQLRRDRAHPRRRMPAGRSADL